MTNVRIIGDWGTSRLRLFRISDGHIVARRDGPGIGTVGPGAEQALAETIEPLMTDGAPDEIALCGMIGARDIWVEAPYADCPAIEDDWRAAAVRFDWRGVPLSIMAGLACVGTDRIADVMRGEETQLFGAFRLHSQLAQGRRLIVLPGTHNKWVLVEDGRILSFRTMPTGEMFALLRDQSVLGAKDIHGDAVQQQAGFSEGLARAADGRLLASLFAARSMRLRAGRSSDWASGYLSGLLIGCEVREAMALLPADHDVTLIGDGRLSDLYGQALGAMGIATRRLDGEACALAGLGFVEMKQS